MSVDLFIDTNVFVYQLDTRDARKHAIADRIVGDALASETACISFQVVQECLNTVLRKAEIALDEPSARAYLDTVLAPLHRVASSAELYRRALGLHTRWKFSFSDALIVAAALEAGCKKLLTEDLQHGQRVETLRIENPFRK
ncbi:MAG: PIN domain-containing protein [Rhizobiales bacterium]|nr:PIN domain-containing protein [Rhizobacter sp.]